MPSGRRFTAPVIAAYICFFYSSILLLFFLAKPLLELLEGRYDNVLNTMYLEKNWILSSITTLLIGYSCLSYSRGVSLKAQQLLTYLAYIYVFYPLFVIFYGSANKKNKLLNLFTEGYGIFIFLFCIFPVTIFKLYQEWHNLKEKRILIFINLIIFILISIVFYYLL